MEYSGGSRRPQSEDATIAGEAFPTSATGKKKAGAGHRLFPESPRLSPRAGAQLRWLLISLVISNIETWAFLKISFSLASALIMVRLALS